MLLLRSVRQSEFSRFLRFLLSKSLTKLENSDCLTEHKTIAPDQPNHQIVVCNHEEISYYYRQEIDNLAQL